MEGISYTRALEIASELKKLSSEVEGILEGDFTSAMNSLGGSWQSDAASQTTAKFNSLKAKFPEFKEAILSYAKYIDDTVEQYKAADAAIGNATQG